MKQEITMVVGGYWLAVDASEAGQATKVKKHGTVAEEAQLVPRIVTMR